MAKTQDFFIPLDEKYYMPRLPGLPPLPEHQYNYFGFAPIRGKGRGFEYYWNNLISDWTLFKAKSFRQNGSEKPCVLGIGSGSGFHELAMARCGLNSIIFDYEPQWSAVNLRNKYLAAECGANGTISVQKENVRNIDADILARHCGKSNLKISMFYNVIHYVDKPDIAEACNAIAQCAAEGAILSFQYVVKAADRNVVDDFYEHKPKEIMEIAQKAGFKLIFSQKGWQICDRVAAQGFCLKHSGKTPSP